MQQRLSTREEYKKQVNNIIEYINNHLDEAIDLNMLAGKSNFSPFHFHRIMKAYLGEPIGAFITRVRVETAARLLRYSDMSVQDIAYHIGYDVPSSLSKIFRQFYGISPTKYRSNKDFVIMKPLQINESLGLKAPKIKDLDPKQVIYIKVMGDYSQLDFCGTWNKLWNYVKENKLFSAGIEHISVYYDDPKVTESDKLRTDICLIIPKPAEPKGEIGVKEIAGGKYAVFAYQGPYTNLGAVYDTIYGQWLPDIDYKLRDNPSFEKYLNNPDNTAPEKLKTEIYIPIE